MATQLESALVVRLETSLAKFERQMNSARQKAATTSTSIERGFDKMGKNVETSATRAATGLQRLTNVSGRGRFVIQNTANQIGDMAVQIGGGTSAMRAMSQQMPQLLGGFGVLGGAVGVLAPLLGTVAALGFPLAAAFLMTGKKAEEAADGVSELSAAVSALQSADEAASRSVSDMRDEYGDLADEAREVLEIQRLMADIRAKAALTGTIRSLSTDLGAGGLLGVDPINIRLVASELEIAEANYLRLTRAMAESADARPDLERELEALASEIVLMGGVVEQVRRLETAFGLAETEAQNVAALFAEFGQATRPERQAEILQELVSYIRTASGDLANASEEGNTLYQSLVQAALEALNLAKIDIASGIGNAADEAGRLRDTLAEARGIRIDGLTKNPDFFDPRNETGTAGQITRPRSNPQTGARTTTTTPTRRGGDGGTNPDLSAAQRMYQDTRSAAERYASEVERINDLHRKFPQIVTEEVRDRAMAALEESVDRLESASQRLEDSMSEAFASIVTGATSAKDALRQLLQQFAQMAIQKGSKALFGAIFDSFIPAFAGGTDFARGGPTLVGEHGPELVNMPRGSQVISAGRTAQMGGGAVIEVRLSDDLDARMAASAEGVAVRVVRQAAPRIQSQTLAAVAEGSRDTKRGVVGF
jgi:exonuclease VII small subunit